jgi:chaperonin GroES
MKQIINIKNISKMNIRPLADRVLIKPAAAEEKTVGGIIIPDSAKEKPLKGEVVAIGNGTKDEEMVVKAGDTVLYGKYAGTEIEFDGEKYLIMRQSDILAII